MPELSSWETAIAYAQNQIAAATAGVLWSARFGGVDPWTKENMVIDQQAALLLASGGGIPEEQARFQAESSVTATLKAANADPSQAGESEDLLKTLGTLLTLALVVGALYLAAQVFIVGKAWKEVLSP